MAIWALNHSIQPSRGYAAITFSTGLRQSRPLDSVVRSMTSTILSLRNNPVTKVELDQKVSELNTFLTEMHTRSQALTEKERERDSRRKKGHLPHFNIGDFVLVARDQYRQKK